MDYYQAISAEHRGLIIVAIDQSGSMLAPFKNVSMITTKSEIASMVASGIIDEFVIRSQQQFRLSDPCPYCDIAVIGYSRNRVESLIHDSTYVLPITALDPKKRPMRHRVIEYVTHDQHLNLVHESWREWVVPKAEGITPMRDMLLLVLTLVTEWCYNKANQNSFPPIIFNITDGLDDYEFTGAHEKLCNAIKQTGTNCGNTLIFNSLIDSCPNSERLQFPNKKDIPDSHPISLLASMSIELPPILFPLGKRYSKSNHPPYTGVCYNATILQVINLLNIDVKWNSWKYSPIFK